MSILGRHPFVRGDGAPDGLEYVYAEKSADDEGAARRDAPTRMTRVVDKPAGVGSVEISDSRTDLGADSVWEIHASPIGEAGEKGNYMYSVVHAFGADGALDIEDGRVSLLPLDRLSLLETAGILRIQAHTMDAMTIRFSMERRL